MGRGVRSLDILSHVRVASPCPASWNSMTGDERVRFCDQCHLHVYNLSGLSREEAERLVLEREGRLCVRFFQRADGTMLTQDCPKGWRLVKRRAWQLLVRSAAIGVACFAGAIGLAAAPRGAGSLRMRFFEPFARIPTWEARVTNWLRPPTRYFTTMGGIRTDFPILDAEWFNQHAIVLEEEVHRELLKIPEKGSRNADSLRLAAGLRLLQNGKLVPPLPRITLKQE